MSRNLPQYILDDHLLLLLFLTSVRRVFPLPPSRTDPEVPLNPPSHTNPFTKDQEDGSHHPTHRNLPSI